MKKIVLILGLVLILSVSIFSQQNTIVSLDNNNVWIYEVNSYKRINTLESYNIYSSVYKIIGDTIISNKETKIINITNYDTIKRSDGQDYWFADENIFQMHNPLYTYYDKNRINDSTWSAHGLGGSFVSGSIKKDSIYLFDNYYLNNIYSIDHSSAYGNYGEGIIATEKFGLVKNISSYFSWYINERMNGNYEMNLAGAIINGEFFGKLEPPEIVNWSINQNELSIDLITNTNKIINCIYFYNYDSTDHKYKVLDSVQTSSTQLSKSLNQGAYNLRVSFTTSDGFESCLSNKISPQILPLNGIVSLDNNNVWIYEVNNYDRIDTIKIYNTFSSVYKIIGDTSISNKEVKIIEITNYDSIKQIVWKDYWFADENIFQMQDPLNTYYDKNRLSDSTWSYSGLGGSHTWGSIRKSNIIVFDSTYTGDIYDVSITWSDGSSATNIISTEKFGMFNWNSEYSRMWPTRNGESNYLLVGAKIENKLYGKLEPPEIIYYSINQNELMIDLVTNANKIINCVYFYNYDSTDHKYKILDSVQTSSTHFIKSLNPGKYNLRISLLTEDGYESALSNKIDLKIQEIEELKLEDFYLFQNYPNPFNPFTTIKYSIPKGSSITIKVYNILGQEITTLMNEEKMAGNYSTQFNASGLSSGVYFYEIKSGDFIQTKKMMLLK